MVGSTSSIARKAPDPSQEMFQFNGRRRLAVNSVVSGSGSLFDASLFNWLSGGGGASGAGGACGNGGTVRHGERNRGSNNRAPLEFSCEFSQRTQSRSLSSFESGLGTKQG